MTIEVQELGDLLSRVRFWHLSPEELDDYVFGKLDELDARRITAHLDLCQVCQRRLAAMRRDYGLYGSALEQG